MVNLFDMKRRKASKAVKTVLISSATFLSGCYREPVVTTTVAERDGVPVVTTYQPGYHFSPFYHGYVPIIVPIGGYSGGINYHTHYQSLPPSQRASYAAPTTRTSSSSGGRISPTTTTNSGRATPTQSSTPAKPSTGPSTTTPTHTTPATGGSVRGIAGGIGHGSAAS